MAMMMTVVMSMRALAAIVPPARMFLATAALEFLQSTSNFFFLFLDEILFHRIFLIVVPHQHRELSLFLQQGSRLIFRIAIIAFPGALTLCIALGISIIISSSVPFHHRGHIVFFAFFVASLVSGVINSQYPAHDRRTT
jgi:hypothetical protein